MSSNTPETNNEVLNRQTEGPRPLKTTIDEIAANLVGADSVIIICTERAGGATHHHVAGRGNHYALVESVRAFLKRVED